MPLRLEPCRREALARMAMEIHGAKPCLGHRDLCRAAGGTWAAAKLRCRDPVDCLDGGRQLML